MAIHVLESDPGVNDSLVVLLENLGYRVVAHRDGASFFRSEPPAAGDCVIVDLALPVIGAAAAIKWLQRLTDPPHIIAMSGDGQSTIEARVRGLQVGPVLRKPLRRDDILARLPRPA